MPAGQRLLEDLRLRRLRGPNLLDARPLLILEGRCSAPAVRFGPARWRLLAEIARGAPAEWVAKVPGAYWQAAAPEDADSTSDAPGDEASAPERAGRLLTPLFSLLAIALGATVAPDVRLRRASGGRFWLAATAPPLGLGEQAASLLPPLLTALAACAEAATAQERSVGAAALDGVWTACRNLSLHPFAPYLIAAAEARNLSVERLPVSDPRFLRVGEGRRQRRFVGALPPRQGSLAMTAAQRRDYLLRQLHEAGLAPVPSQILQPGAQGELPGGEGRYLLRPLQRAPQEETPKPLEASELAERLAALPADGPPALVQRLPAGVPLRLFLFEGRCLGVASLPLGAAAPPPAVLPPDVHRMALDVATVTGLALASLDIVLAPAEEGGAPVMILDLDPEPEPTGHLTASDCRRLADAMVGTSFPADGDGRIQSVTVATADPQPLLSDLERSLRQAGRRVGTALGATAVVEGRVLPGPRPSVLRLLDDRATEVALAAASPESVRREGLPFARSDAALLDWRPDDAAWLAAARLLAAHADCLLLPFDAQPDLLAPPSACRLVAYGREAEVPAWAAAAVCAVEEGEDRRLLLALPGERPPQLLALLPPGSDALRQAASAALLHALKMPAGRPLPAASVAGAKA